MGRVTKEILNKQVEYLNKLTQLNFALEYAYGGVKVVRCCDNGQTNISIRGTKRDISKTLLAMSRLAELV